MDFGGMLGLDGLVGSSSESGCGFSSPLTSLDAEPMKQKGLFGSSGLFKHERSCDAEEQQEEWRSLKVGKSEAMLPSKAAPFLLRSNSHSLFPDGEQMLSFSSSKPDALVLNNDGSLPSYHHHHYHHPSYSSPSTASFYRNAGWGSGSSNVSMHGVMSGVRGPFTPSQWMELEHQALIYKYIDANVPIPSSLLIPIRRSMNPSGLSPYPSGSFRSTALGWGSFHLGFSGNADPEPGRCRRTDGKKWRCSRDAVADQKYCERHMNRGRHRSRKHVEGHTGHASKAMPIIAPGPSQSTSAASGGMSSSSLTTAQQLNKSLQPNVSEPSPSQFGRSLVSKENINNPGPDSQRLSMLTTVNPKPMDTLFHMPKQHNPFEGTSSRPDFGLISTDSLLNPRRTSYSENLSFNSTSPLNDRHSHTYPLRHFIDDWPKSQSDRPPITWPDVEDMKSDRTQLSISIPTDFSSSSSSPNQEKLALSPLRLSREFNPMNEGSQRQASWIPISWEPTLGGPLGEVLTNTSSTPKNLSKNCSSSSLNLLTDGWDSSPRLESSPTGVLQKTTFGSLSSSTGSSPRAENHRAHDSTGSMCDDLLGSTLVNPLTVPSL